MARPGELAGRGREKVKEGPGELAGRGREKVKEGDLRWRCWIG